jgi:hypothetical protein
MDFTLRDLFIIYSSVKHQNSKGFAKLSDINLTLYKMLRASTS